MPRSSDRLPAFTRREFLLGGFGWWPFGQPRSVRLAGAEFRIVRNGRSPRHYVHIHGNESTAREVLEDHIRRHSGAAFFIRGHERNVKIGSGVLDPNRMFSADGARANLTRLNPHWGEGELTRALDLLDRGRERLLRALLPPAGGVLIAVHNNQEYSVRDEAAASQKISLKQPEHPREFFLCTDARDYSMLAASPYNVVLQDSPPPPDDGSLSRLAARRGVRYVNLECALGNRAGQIERLEWAEKHLA